MFKYSSHHDCQKCLDSGANDKQRQSGREVVRETFTGKVKFK